MKEIILIAVASFLLSVLYEVLKYGLKSMKSKRVKKPAPKESVLEGSGALLENSSPRSLSSNPFIGWAGFPFLIFLPRVPDNPASTDYLFSDKRDKKTEL